MEEGAALAGRPPLDLRVNTLKADREKVARQLARLGVAPTPYSPVGLRIPPAEAGRASSERADRGGFQRGRFEVQDEGSQIAALLVGAKPGEQVLDLCAGAGGKTLALAASMDNRGQIYAYDGDKNRLAPIFDRLKRAGARNVQVRPPASKRARRPAGPHGPRARRRALHGDRRLAAPPGRKVAGHAGCASEARRRAGRGAQSRRRAFVKPGGVLAYTTCSVLPAENGERIAAFLAAHPELPARIPMRSVWDETLPSVAPPEGSLGETSLLLTPRRSGTDGFFLACLRRDD